MTKDDLDDHMRGWFQRLQAQVEPQKAYAPVKIQTVTTQFTGKDVKPALKRLQVLGTTNSNTNEDNRNV